MDWVTHSRQMKIVLFFCLVLIVLMVLFKNILLAYYKTIQRVF